MFLYGILHVCPGVDALRRNSLRRSRAVSPSAQDEILCPKWVVIMPTSPPARFEAWSRPSAWIDQDLRLFFLCPLSMTTAGVGFDVRMSEGSLEKLAPALAMGLDLLE